MQPREFMGGVAAQFHLTLTTETAWTLAADLDIAARGAEASEEARDGL